MQERKGGGALEAAAASGRWGPGAGELRRELHTALGTAKWQLDELERAVKSNDNAILAGKDTRARHDDFVSAIGHRILEVENFLKETNTAEGRGPLSWVRLDEGERDELALFLSAGPHKKRDEVVTIPAVGDIEVGSNERRVRKDVSVDSSNDSSGSAESSLALVKEDSTPGHRRAASAYADIGLWSILISNEGNGLAEQSSVDQHKAPFAKSPSSFVFMNALQSKPRMKYKSVSKKWAGVDQQDSEESLPLTNSQLGQGDGGCFQRSKSYLSTCDEDAYNKKLYGCLGAFRRILQRSQYQFQYGRPVQLIVLALAVFLILICAFRTFW